METKGTEFFATAREEGTGVKVHKFADGLLPYLTALDAGEVEIDTEMYYYWLEVLPPVFMGRTITMNGSRRRVEFAFAEGTEQMVLFFYRKDSDTGEDHFYAVRSIYRNTPAGVNALLSTYRPADERERDAIEDADDRTRAADAMEVGGL